MRQTRTGGKPATTLMLVILIAGTAIAQVPRSGHRQDNTPTPTIIENRIELDSNACPAAVAVWLRSLNDTVAGLELSLSWDRPDFARFALTPSQSSGRASDPSGKDSLAEALSRLPASTRRPMIETAGGGLQNWEYVEARGANGLTLKVTAIANLISGPKGASLFPCDSVLLFRIPIVYLYPDVHSRGGNDSDSATVWIERLQTRLSTPHGQLIEGLDLRAVRLGRSSCQDR